MSEVVRESLNIISASGPVTRRNNPIKTDFAAPVAALISLAKGKNTRAVSGIVLLTNEAGQLQCPESNCSEVFAEEVTLREHVYQQIQKGGTCVICPDGRELDTRPNRQSTVEDHIRAHIENGRKSKCCGK